MFERYDTFKMHIYETRRTAAYPQDIYDIVRKNAENARLV